MGSLSRNMPLLPRVREEVVKALEVERIIRATLAKPEVNTYSEAWRISNARVVAMEWALGTKDDKPSC